MTKENCVDILTMRIKGEVIAVPFLSYSTELTEVEAAERLIVQAENHGTFALLVGATPFHLLLRLDLFQKASLVDRDIDPDFSLGYLRIFNYARSARDEYGTKVTLDGKIEDAKGCIHEPEELLSLEAAPSGWEAHGLVPGHGNILKRWLNESHDTKEGAL